MKGTDKFLIAIVAGVLLLVGIAVVAVLRRTPETYASDDKTENVAHNYLLALQKRDYARAYGYLSPSLKRYPATLDQFVNDMHRYITGDYFEDVSLEISPNSFVDLPDSAEVVVRQTQTAHGRFLVSQYSTLFRIMLHRENGQWKIKHSDEYWYSCWSDSLACPSP